MLPLGTTAPDFSLPDFEGRLLSRDQVRGPNGLLVVFMCNHCPYVKHVAGQLAKIGDECISANLGIVGISSNDVTNYPDDGPEQMKQEAAKQGYRFPYLYDESQVVARSFRAACTPDFFLFDAELRLTYRGQMDDTRPKRGEQATGKDLRDAIQLMLSGQPIPKQCPSIGCNIKWKAGAEPEYFNPAGIG
jgi:peroxiredoxin